MPRRTSKIQVCLLSCDWGGVTACVNTFSAIQLNSSGYETQKSKILFQVTPFYLIVLLHTEILCAPSERHRAPTDPSRVRGLAYGREGQISESRCNSISVPLTSVSPRPGTSILVYGFRRTWSPRITVPPGTCLLGDGLRLRIRVPPCWV